MVELKIELTSSKLFAILLLAAGTTVSLLINASDVMVITVASCAGLYGIKTYTGAKYNEQ